jgi:predicted ATPase
MIKIAITGAHGTGKTTLISRLPHDISFVGRVAVCREAPRLVIARVGDSEFFRVNNNTPIRQSLIFLEHIMEERRQGKACDLLVTDRTLIDHLSYSAVLFPEHEKSLEFKICKELAFESLLEYDIVFKIPIEFAAVDDGVREGLASFQSAIDTTIDRFYSEARIPTLVVRGSIEDRVSIIQQAIRQTNAHPARGENS